MTKKFYIKTLGCKVNQCDSQEIRQGFLSRGLAESRRIEEADIFIVNTCCVTHQADRKSRYAIREALRYKKNKNSFLAVTGCYAEYDTPAIKNIDDVDGIFVPSKRDDLFKRIDRFVQRAPSAVTVATSFGHRTRAFLKIQEGCDHYCSYCIVPLVRGRSRSKGYLAALDEAKRLVQAGHREIVLTGVCLGRYGADLSKKAYLVDFISDLENIQGLFRLRLSSLEASDISDELIDKMSTSKKLCPHLHIPFQTGDDDILRDMNKKLTVRDYRHLIEKAYQKIKNLAITCDFIIGYPGETEANFKNTLEFVRFLKPLKAHLFTYSARRGTSLFNRNTKLYPAALVKSRFARMRELCEEMSLEYKQKYIGKNLTVLFEEKVEKGWQGYSENYMKVLAAVKKPLKNTFARVKVTGANREGLTAILGANNSI